MTRQINNYDREQGSALPLTLIVLAILTTLAMVLSSMARSQVEEARLLSQQWNAQLAIHDSTQKILLALLTGQVGGREVTVDDISWPTDGSAISIDGVEVRIQDVAGLMSIGYYSEKDFRSLLEKLTDEPTAAKLAAELGDWIDADDFVRYKGMERGEYDAAGLYGYPRNDHLRSLDELLLLPGMTPEIYNGDSRSGTPGLRDLVVPGGMGWFNAASAPEVLLAPYLNISEQDAKKLIAARNAGNWTQFQKIVHKGGRFFEMPPDTPGIEFRIISKSGAWKARMHIRLSPLTDKPFEILQWYYPDYGRE